MVAQRARDLGPLAIERLGEILRDPKSKDGAVIRAAELLLERGYGKAPVFHTNDPAEFRDVLRDDRRGDQGSACRYSSGAASARHRPARLAKSKRQRRASIAPRVVATPRGGSAR